VLQRCLLAATTSSSARERAARGHLGDENTKNTPSTAPINHKYDARVKQGKLHRRSFTCAGATTCSCHNFEVDQPTGYRTANLHGALSTCRRAQRTLELVLRCKQPHLHVGLLAGAAAGFRWSSLAGFPTLAAVATAEAPNRRQQAPLVHLSVAAQASVACPLAPFSILADSRSMCHKIRESSST